EDLSSLVDDIKEGAVRTIEIVKGLRVFSRLDEEDMKDANINECLDATLVLLKNKTKNSIKITKKYDDELPEILCYPGQLNQVFMNIINNAIQAMPEDKENAEITVATEKTKEGINIRLKDNGSGMSDEVKQRIFEPFFTTKPVGVGTGLGMSISYGIIEKHHGQLHVESELGVGTEFIIELPKAVGQILSEAS
ncbi:MAG: ATP-binding protein, partial [Bacteroidota bacterium]